MRRLVVCCDGTWNSADSGGAATNVLRLARIVRPVAADGTDQIVYYDNGVGTGGLIDKLGGGAVGVGLSRNVRQAYAFLVNNYRDGDEIFLFGFSRGAYTARAVGGLIGRIGLLRKRQMGAFAEAWDWNRRAPPERDAARAAFEARFDGRRTEVPVRCIGVWDTVGAMGIPAGRVLGKWQPCSSAFRFHNADLGARVQHAFHALALDERRPPFQPLPWNRPKSPAQPQVLRQVWFRGVHSDVGGGYEAHGAADLAMLWMAEQLTKLLDLDPDGLAHELDGSESGPTSRIHDSHGGSWKLFGGTWRRPAAGDNGQYVHESALTWRGPVDGALNPEFDLAGLPVWTPTGLELSHATTRSARHLGARPLPLLQRGACDRVLDVLGGG
jgi:uncharacterized protein (DUF2235 family)